MLSTIPQQNSNFGLFRAGVIYVLKCPDTGLVRYVGKTFDIKSRLKEHFNPSLKERSRRSSWLKSVLYSGKKPIFEIIDDCDEFNWSEKERAYIKLYKSFGANLTNTTAGGEQGSLNYNHEESTRKRISDKMKVYKKTEEHNKNVSNSLKDKWRNDANYIEKSKKNCIDKLSKITKEQRLLSDGRRSITINRSKEDSVALAKKIKAEIDKKERNRTEIAKDFDMSYGMLKDLLRKHL